MIREAARQLTELLDELGLAARIEEGRYEPNLQSVNTVELARGAVVRAGGGPRRRPG
jgi:signal transduction histidine kinase